VNLGEQPRIQQLQLARAHVGLAVLPDLPLVQPRKLPPGCRITAHGTRAVGAQRWASRATQVRGQRRRVEAQMRAQSERGCVRVRAGFTVFARARV
jgi:hypothetical protein